MALTVWDHVLGGRSEMGKVYSAGPLVIVLEKPDDGHLAPRCLAQQLFVAAISAHEDAFRTRSTVPAMGMYMTEEI
jgi:hypothetical protein